MNFVLIFIFTRYLWVCAQKNWSDAIDGAIDVQRTQQHFRILRVLPAELLDGVWTYSAFKYSMYLFIHS